MMRQQQEQKAAMQALDGMEEPRSKKEGDIQGNKDVSQVRDVSSPAVGSSAPVIGSTLNRPQNDISSPETGQEKAEDNLDTFATYHGEKEILEDENKMQEREKRWEEWEDIVKLWGNNEPPFPPQTIRGRH
ncbi:C2H2-type domain-containing protein [Trichoderma simmonsii]|uniref:C2H2-type domain-containing protein n=1 Tax=Trichoderma simmonsii TaxID=1491479 RepID=A0A8G0LLL6_9HYPO|nr:C2H2-type domain-containing protein [Trichoderma simmonsii]